MPTPERRPGARLAARVRKAVEDAGVPLSEQQLAEVIAVAERRPALAAGLGLALSEAVAWADRLATRDARQGTPAAVTER
jgi:hypothetical protein